jgi:cyanophycin synthetase
MVKREDFDYYSTYLIVKEAEERGAKVHKFFKKGILENGSHVLLNYKGKEEIIVGQRTSETDCIAYWIQQNKALTKQLLAKDGIEVSKGRAFHYGKTKEIVKYCKQLGYPVVIKPLGGIQGAKVFVGISSDKEVREILEEYKTGIYKTILVEKEFHGKEYRIFATKDKFIAATNRVPANVKGDGESSISKLIKIKNEDPRRGTGHKKSLVNIKVDGIVKDFLEEQKLTLASIPKKDEIIYLRPNSNLSTGGDSYDVTDITHPEIKKLAPRIIKALPGLAYGGIDYMTDQDITKPPRKGHYIIIEINDSPMISMHHFPFEGKERDAASAIVDQLYPESRKAKKKHKKTTKKSNSKKKIKKISPKKRKK